MTGPQKNRTIVIIGIITIITGILVMAGWLLNIPLLEKMLPAFTPMAFNSAACFVLFGTALILTLYPGWKYKTPLFFLLSLSGTLIGLITLLQFLFHFNTGLDQLFVTDKGIATNSYLFPGRMAFNAAVNFTLLGLGFLMLAAKKRLYDLIAQYLFHAVTILSAIALVGYLYGVSLFNSLLYVSSMATHTAILFFILSVAAALLNPSTGMAKLFTGRQVGNQMARWLFALVILMVVLFGALRIQAQYSRLFTLNTGIPLLAVCFLLMSLVIIWTTAAWLNKIDARRSEAEAKIKLMNADLEKLVEERSAEIKKVKINTSSFLKITHPPCG